MAGWRAFVNEMDQFYDINMNCLTKEFDKEQRDYYKATAQWSEVHPHQLLSAPVCFKTYDLLTVTLEELQASHPLNQQPRNIRLTVGSTGSRSEFRYSVQQCD